MTCRACGCPGAYTLFVGAVCWNRKCRHFHQDVVSGSDFSADGQYVNGDPIEDVKAFLGEDFEF